jgi:hypothetical protein
VAAPIDALAPRIVEEAADDVESRARRRGRRGGRRRSAEGEPAAEEPLAG